jgi:hypothetical protein
MDSIGPDPGPDLFLSQDDRHLKALAAPLRDTPSRDALGALEDALRLHASVEERVCFPPLLSASAAAAGEVVAAARKVRGALLESLRGLAESPRWERPRLGAGIADRLDAYAAFEETRLVPLFARLPGVTLREMGLEIQELVGPPGRARGA